MSRHLAVLTVCIFCMAADLSAQLGTASPYSMYGLGEINELTSGRLAGKGGSAIAMRSPGLLNHANPASYTAFDTLSFVMDVSVAGKSSRFQAGDVTERMRSANIFKMAFGFRVTSRWASSLGIMPFSSVGYNLQAEQDIEGLTSTNTVKYSGNGGLTRILWGNAFKLTPALSVGVNTSFLFGTITNAEQQRTWDIEKTLQTHKFYWDFGLQYIRTFKRRAVGVAGLVYGYRGKLTMNREVQITSYSSELFDEQLRNQTLYLPSFIGVGASYARRNNFQVSFDYTFRKWSDMKAFGGARFEDTHRVNMGVSIIPDAQNPKTYFDRIEYQAGLSVGNAYLSFNNKNAMQAVVSLGAGLPIGSSIVDIVYSYGIFGRTGYRQMQERFHKITLGLTLKETWFYKFLYQ